MTRSYLAFLRGINVGGNNLIKMADLKATLAAQPELQDVRTYIQSGNVIFTSAIKDTDKLAELIETAIESHFQQPVSVAVFSKSEWQQIIDNAPASWGKNAEWKHNILIMLKPYDMPAIVKAYGEIKPGIEAIDAGKGVLYQSISWKDFGKSTGGKLAANSIYKQMTVRNYNTATKLLGLL